jgi:hypothetical protein
MDEIHQLSEQREEIAQTRNESEKRFNSGIRDEIEKDIDRLSFRHLLENPSTTSLKQIMTRGFTHYRTEPVIISGSIETCKASFAYHDWKKYSCFYNMGIQVMVSHSSFEQAIRSVDLEFKFDNRTIFACKGDQFYHVLVMHPTLYEETRNTYERTKILNIPLQRLICENTYLPGGDIDVSISFDNFEFSDQIIRAELSAVGIVVCSDQGRKYMYCSSETMIKSYHFYPNVQNELPIDMEVGIFKLLALPTDGRTAHDTLKIGNAQLIRTDSMFNRCNRYVRDILNGYFYASREEAGSLDRAYQTHGLCYSHPGSTKVTIDSNNTYDICVMFQNAMVTMGHNDTNDDDDDIPGCRFKYPPIVNDHVPQPGTPFFKVSDTEFIEGYWAPKQRMYAGDAWHLYNYPIVTDEPVDTEFLIKLENLLWSAKSEFYLGLSTCRVCSENNGASEYSIEKNGVTFRLPEGMMHYYREHKVHPSPEFREFIYNY